MKRSPDSTAQMLALEELRSGTIASLAMMPFGLLFKSMGLRVGHYGPKVGETLFGHQSGIRPEVFGDTWDHPDPSQWSPVDVSALPEARRVQFLSRKRAIELYLDGATDAVLQKETGLKRRNVYRLVTERCLSQAEDGTIQGWRGALSHMRIKEYAHQGICASKHADSQ